MKYKIGDVLTPKNEQINCIIINMTSNFYNLKYLDDDPTIYDCPISFLEDLNSFKLDEQYMKTKQFEEEMKDVINS